MPCVYEPEDEGVVRVINMVELFMLESMVFFLFMLMLRIIETRIFEPLIKVW